MGHNEARDRAGPRRHREVYLYPESNRKPLVGFRPRGDMKGPCWLLGKEGPRGTHRAGGGAGAGEGAGGSSQQTSHPLPQHLRVRKRKDP